MRPARQATHTLLLGLVGLLAAGGCRFFGPGRSPEASGSQGGDASTPSRVALVNVEDRPPLALVAREGDPRPAVAFAAAHDHGSRASAAIAALLESRLGRHGFPAAESRAHALGFHLATLVTTPDDAARFVRGMSAAIAQPVAEGEPALAAVRVRLAGLAARGFAGPGEAAAAACSGDPGLLVAAGEKTEPSVAELEAWRRAVHSARASAFAALGPSALRSRATAALEEVTAWPGDVVPNDPWPTGDVVAIDPASGDERRVSVALRLADAGAAVEAARLLGKPGASLSARLGAFEPGWTVERVVGTTRPRGACLRVDARGPRGEPAPALADVAAVALTLQEEMERAAARARRSEWSLEDGVLRPTDPRHAAAIAAWRTLGGRLESGEPRRVVSYVAPAGAPSGELSRTLANVARAWQHKSLDLRSRIEAGQGEIWVLIGSPCGTGGESASDAGLTALALRAAAEHESGDVALEPWLTPAGVGLLAHGPRRSPRESATDHARRVAAVLGRALTTRLSGSDVAEARADLAHDLGPGPDPGYWAAVEAAAPGHPSWLEPRGTWSSVSNATVVAVEAQRRALLRMPLRIAMLANADDAQALAAHDEIERWLRPLRSSTTACKQAERTAARSGELSVEVAPTNEPRAAAYVSVPLPAGPPREAVWTELLLNRPSGWLDQALRAPGLTGAARARVLGGPRAAALVIEVGTFDDQVDAAVQQVRALLERLSRGAARPEDAEIARAHAARASELAALDPRRRVVDLWRGREPAAPDLQSLRRFQRFLAPSSHVVVRVKRRE